MNGTVYNDKILDQIDENSEGIYAVPSYVQDQISSKRPEHEGFTGPRSAMFEDLLKQQPLENKWVNRKKQ